MIKFQNISGSFALTLLLLLQLTIGSSAIAMTSNADDGAASRFVDAYFATLKKSRKAFVHGGCKLEDGGSASVVIPVGNPKGLFIEWDNDGVVNTAEIIWKNGDWHIDVAQGGLYTIERVNNLAKELLGSPLRIIAPEKGVSAVMTQHEMPCVEKPPK